MRLPLVRFAVVGLALSSGLAFASGRAALTPEDVVDVPQCRGLLTLERVAALRADPVDPLARFEEMRKARHVELRVPPQVNCDHMAWSAAHRALPGPVTEQSPYAGAFERAVAPLAASIGANLTPGTNTSGMTGNTGVTEYQGETTISVNPFNPLQMVASANTYYRDPKVDCQAPSGAAQTYGLMELWGSTDGGQTWIRNCSPWHPSVTGGVTGATSFYGSDPAVAWDRNGNAYTAYMLISDNGTKQGVAIVTAKSTNAGASWAPLGVVVDNISSTTNFDDKELIAIDTTAGGPFSGRQYVIWDEGNRERVANSTDGGATWTTVVVNTGGKSDIGGNVTVGDDSTVYAAWTKVAGGGDSTLFRKSTDGGATWSTAVTAATQQLASFGTNNSPPAQDSRSIDTFVAIDVDKNAASAFHNRLYICYTDVPAGTTTGTNTNVYVVRSTDGGTTWSAPVAVNDDAGTATQFFPWLSVDQSDGTVNVAWYDTRNDSTNNTKTQVFYARSTDGGLTFEPNLVISDGGAQFVNHVNYSDENSTDNTLFNGNQYGDYSGIWAANRQAHVFMTDSRQFYPTSGDARVEEAMTATITNCTAPTFVTTPTTACSSSGIKVDWTAATAFGTNATAVTYTLTRYTNMGCTANPFVVATGISALTANDAVPPTGTTYFYQVAAKNNCPGTPLTAMSTLSSCSAGITDAASPAVTAPAGSTVTQTLGM
ncbi:MAG TPA: sialidase family protein [Thermoanaerobaculia bacterium]|nr:sialidase family protein [Thermoanaerobaculia bacterium]